MGGKYDEDFGEEKKWDHILNLCFELFDNSCVEKILLIVTVLKTLKSMFSDLRSISITDLFLKIHATSLIYWTQFSYPSP